MTTDSSEIINELTAVLTRVAPVYRGKSGISSNASPPKYTIIDLGNSKAPFLFRGGNASPRIIDARMWQLGVHIWGHNRCDIDRMFAALASALWTVSGPGRYEIGDGVVAEDGDIDDLGARFGYRLLQQVSVYTEVPQVTFPTTTAAAGDTPCSSVTSAEYVEVQATDAVASATGATHDGILEESES